MLVFYGGVSIKQNHETLTNDCPHIVVGTPGRVLALIKDKSLNLKKVKHFVLDECDKMLEQLDMRHDVQNIFKMTPHDKQVMMFSATLNKEIRLVCKKFMQDVSAYIFYYCFIYSHVCIHINSIMIGFIICSLKLKLI